MLSIILPTYNESKSIKTTIHSILNQLENTNSDYEIIVSDDNSPDKTWEIVQDLSKKNNKIHLLRRYKNRGLSPAVLDAFKIAKGNFFLVMDADGQHDETKIQTMLKEIQNHDIVVGSRYIKDGKIDDWAIHRIFVSKFASYLAYPLLKKKKINDPLSGFFMIKKTLFEKLPQNMNVSGYKILLDILFASPNTVKIKEIPYKFKNRDYGKSKLGSKVIIEYINMLIKQLLKQNLILIKFLTVGSIGTIVNLTLMYILVEYISFSYMLASTISVEISIINNFILNNTWTFSSRKIKNSILNRFLKFNLTSLFSLVINVSILLLLVHFGIWYLIAQFIGIIFAFIINFAINNIWVFKDD